MSVIFNGIDKISDFATKMRMRHFGVEAVYRRDEQEWKVILCPCSPQTPGLDFDGHAMFVDGVDVVIPVAQPDGNLQFVKAGEIVFVPHVGDKISFTVGGLNMEYELVERGDRPCWFFLFGNREIQVFAEKLRKEEQDDD